MAPPVARLHGLVALSRLVRARVPVERLLDAVAATIAETLRYRTVVICLHRPASDDFLVSTVHGGPEVARALLGSRSTWDLWRPFLAPAFERRGAYDVRAGALDWRAADALPSYRPQPGPVSGRDAWHPEDSLFVPLTGAEGELLGIVSVDEPISGLRPTDDDLDLLVAVAAHAAQALVDGAAAEQDERSRRALEHLVAVSARVPDTLRPEPVLDLVCRGVHRALGWDRVALGLLADGRLRHAHDAVRGAFAEAFAGLEPDRLDALLAAGRRIEGCHLLDPATTRELWPQAAPPPPAPAPGAEPAGSGRVWAGHALLVPLRDRTGQLLGLLRADGPADGLKPRVDDLALLRLYADQATAALDNAAQRALARERERARSAALTDHLTGLPNRSALERHLEAALRPGRAAAVLHLGLDGFRLVNDCLGHAAGDDVLRAVADRVLAAVDGRGMLVRPGGDELLVGIEGVGGTPRTTALEIAEAVHAALEEPITVDGVVLYADTTIGVALAPTHAHDVAGLLRAATSALEEGKRTGERTSLRRRAASARSPRRLAVVTGLRRALEGAPDAGTLELHYQPMIDVLRERIVCLEALLRWRTAHGELVPPGEFIPLAESTGLIEPLGAWVLDAATAQAAAWLHGGFPHVRVAINVSPRQLRRTDLEADLRGALARHALPPEALAIEVTESALVPGVEHLEETLHRVRALGMHVGLDDFGADHANFARLRDLPVDTLKIDRAFLDGVPADAGAAGILRAMCDLGGALGLKVVAEGVEDAAQLTFLTAIGCPLVQGFHLGRPVPVAEATALLDAQERGPRLDDALAA